MKKNLLILVILLELIILHFFILKTITFTAWPEMFSYPFLISNGYSIYKDIAHPYVPLLTFILAIYYKLVGINLVTHQYLTWGLILLNDLLIFLISWRFLKSSSVLIPVGIYIFLQPIFEGNMLWFDLGTTPFILGSFLIFSYLKNMNRKLFWFGFLLALALLIKQQTIIMITLITAVLFFSRETRKSLFFYLLGLFIPICFIFLILVTLRVFNDYLFWTLTFPLVWLPKFPGYTELPTTRNVLLMILLFGLPTIYLITKFLSIDLIRRLILVSIVATVVMAFPRFSFFHLQPAIVILVIFYSPILKESRKIFIMFLIPTLLTGTILWKDYRSFIGIENARFYDQNEFELARFIKENSAQDDKVYFIGPHSLLFILSNRLPPHPWIENYVWHFEIPGLQEKQIEGFKRERDMVIFKQPANKGQWYELGVYQPEKIEEYINNNFKLVNKHPSGLEVWKQKISK